MLLIFAGSHENFPVSWFPKNISTEQRQGLDNSGQQDVPERDEEILCNEINLGESIPAEAKAGIVDYWIVDVNTR